jgi:hypothetical protein
MTPNNSKHGGGWEAMNYKTMILTREARLGSCIWERQYICIPSDCM